MDRTDPSHLRGLNRPFSEPDAVEPRTRIVQSRAVYNLPKGLDGLAKFDATLSHLCQRGAFNQETDGYYWARSPDRRYGVAFPTGGSLIDPQNQRRPGQVYFFDGQESRCRVYVGDLKTLLPNYVRQ